MAEQVAIGELGCRCRRIDALGLVAIAGSSAVEGSSVIATDWVGGIAMGRIAAQDSSPVVVHAMPCEPALLFDKDW